MRIWVDADACPKPVKEMLFRVAERRQIMVTLVANQFLTVPSSPHIGMIQVGSGFDVADDKIVSLCDAGDLVVTADIPLAAAVVKKGGTALNPRGELYTDDNIGQVLAMRNIMDTLRSGVTEISGGPPSFNQKDREKFANQLDKFIMQALKK